MDKNYWDNIYKSKSETDVSCFQSRDGMGAGTKCHSGGTFLVTEGRNG